MTCVSGNSNIVSLLLQSLTTSAEQGGSDGQLFDVVHSTLQSRRDPSPAIRASRVTVTCQRTTITNAIHEYVTTDVR